MVIMKEKPAEVNYEDLREEVNCCIPIGFCCQQPDVEVDKNNSVKLKCSRSACKLPGLVHQKCFYKIEAQAVSALGNVKGRAREWSNREREKNLWHDRGYELIYRMFPCRCGHGFLRKEEEDEVSKSDATVLQHGNILRTRKKSEKEKPKLNINPKLVSQKGLGQYFPDNTILDKCSPSMKSINPSTSQGDQVIPGLSVEGQPKPMRLNIDLSEIQDGEKKEDGSACLENNPDHESSDENLRLLKDNGYLNQINVQLKEKIVEDRSLYEEYLQYMIKENDALKTNLVYIHQLKEKEDRRKKELEEKIEELKHSVEDEKKTSSFLRGLILEEFVKTESPQPANSSITEPSWSFVSDEELHQITEKKFHGFEVISDKLLSNQNKTKEKMAYLQHNLQRLHLENIEFRNEVNKMRNILSLFDKF